MTDAQLCILHRRCKVQGLSYIERSHYFSFGLRRSLRVGLRTETLERIMIVRRGFGVFVEASRNCISHRSFGTQKRRKDDGSMYLVRAGLPMMLFCGLGVWVVANGIDGKNKERDLFQGRLSK